MENNSFQTSFIPKKPLMTSTVSDKEPKNFFSIIATFLLIASIAVAVGLFVYKIYLTKQEESLSVSLSTTRDSFEKSTIDELELFDKRTETAKDILSKHIVLSPMFALLGELTIPSVQYTNFDQKTDDTGFLVNIQGIASDYRSIALQADMFNTPKGKSFTNVLFSNLVKDKNNNVTFNLKFNVSPDLLSYEKNNLLEQNQGVTANTPVAPAPTTTTNPLSQNLGGATQ
jgi:hypothetical protein